MGIFFEDSLIDCKFTNFILIDCLEFQLDYCMSLNEKYINNQLCEPLCWTYEEFSFTSIARWKLGVFIKTLDHHLQYV